MTELSQILLSLLPEAGEPIGRKVLQDALSQQIGEEIADATIDELLYNLTLRRKIEWIEEGRQVRLDIPGKHPQFPPTVEKERDLEPWLERYLWLNPSLFFDPVPQGLKLMIQNTARIAAGTGRWSRPDICMAAVTRYKYQPSTQLSIYTFELKMPSGTETRSVFEALAHTSSGHYPFLVLYLPTKDAHEQYLEGVLEQAQRHGVGVIRITNVQDSQSYKRLLDAERFEPPQASIDALIDERFDRANRLALFRWVRT